MADGFETRTATLGRLGGDEGRAARVAEVGRRLRADGWHKVRWSARPEGESPPGGDWVDHRYALEHSNGRFVYVSEHYGLTPGVLAELSSLVEAGWDVSLGADRSLYIPGLTVAIWVERAPPSVRYTLVD